LALELAYISDVPFSILFNQLATKFERHKSYTLIVQLRHSFDFCIKSITFTSREMVGKEQFFSSKIGLDISIIYHNHQTRKERSDYSNLENLQRGD